MRPQTRFDAPASIDTKALPEALLTVEMRNTVPAQVQSDLRLGQLLCARLCHDLIGAAGALNAGLEFLNDGTGEEAGTFDLIAMSARQLQAKLAFFRAAFGLTGREGALTLKQARTLTEELLSEGRVRLAWRITDDGGTGAVSADFLRLVLCLILVGAEALPRGGDLQIEIETSAPSPRVQLHARGTGARFSETTIAALTNPSLSEVNPRNVHAYYAKRLADEALVYLSFTHSASNEVVIEAEAAEPSARRALCGTAIDDAPSNFCRSEMRLTA